MIWPFKSWRTPQELVSCLGDLDPKVRADASQELVSHEDPETDVLVLSTLQTLGDAPKAMTIALIDVIGRRGIENGISALKKFLDNPDQEIKLYALRALARIPIQASLDLLIPLLAADDVTVKKEVRIAIVSVFGDKAMGALIRGIPDDTSSTLYFEIVSLFEEMGFFEKLQENFHHPDPEVKKFHLQNLMKFHNPNFVPLYLEALSIEVKGLQEKICRALREYGAEELLPFSLEELVEAPSKKLFSVLEEVVIERFPETKTRFLIEAKNIDRPELRMDFLERIFKKTDSLIFFPVLPFLEDPTQQIRNLTVDYLVKLVKSLKFRLTDPGESNRDFLRGEVQKWTKELTNLIQNTSQSDSVTYLAKVFLPLTQDRPKSLLPLLPKLLSQQFNLTVKHLGTWETESMETLLSETIRRDKSVSTTLINGVLSDSSPELIRVIMKNLECFDKNDITNFRKSFASKVVSGKYPNFYEDPDPLVRTAALELMTETGNDSYTRRVEEKCKDPDPTVRQKAFEIARRIRHPKVIELLEDACADPSPQVALSAIQEIRKLVHADKFASLLAKSINSPIEELRKFALQEIAKITQKKYIENYNKLSPGVRKLAGSALLKLDASFVDHVIAELRSLAPDSRLRAAMILENLQIGGKGKEALLAGMKDPSKKVRAAIVKTLGIMGDKSLLSSLIEFFNDPDERVRANAIEAVSAIGDDRAIKLLLPFLEDSNNRIRANAALAVWQIGKVNPVPILSKMLNDKDTLMKASALWVIGEMKQEIFISMIVPFLSDKAEIVRTNSVRALAKINPQVLKPYLANLRKDSSQEIKEIIKSLSFKLI